MNSVTSNIKEALHHYFGFDEFKNKQEEIIKSLLDGKDTFVIMPTGGGKSMCYQLPALMSEGTAIIVSPLIALMKNQVDAIRSYSKHDHIAHFLNSTLRKGEMLQVKEDIQVGKTKLLYIAPETLTKEENMEFFRSVKISFVAVDEAHCISEWGHDFRPEYRRIHEMVQTLGDNVPVMALTATATPKVRADIKKNLGMTEANEFTSSFNRDNLYYEIRPKRNKNEVVKQMVQIIKALPGESGIIYVQARKTTEEIAEVLSVNGIKASAYHAGMDSKNRVKVQDGFLMEDIDVIVATIAFGMGIDKPDVRFVMHFDIPKSIENYYQETGRAGRDGAQAACYAFFSQKDVLRLEKFLRDKTVAERDMGVQLLDEIVAYSETATCRRKYLLHYFGEAYDEARCNDLCDNCRFPKDKEDVKEDILLSLRVVAMLNEQFNIKVLVDFVCGKKTKEINDFRMDQKEDYGAGKDKEDMYWLSIFRQSLMQGFLLKDVEQYGILKLTAKGKEYQETPTSILMAVDRDFKGEDEIVPVQKSSALDQNLLILLKELRLDVAKNNNVKPWIVFFDPTLTEMATQYPISTAELMQITGVSKGKVDRYGHAFTSLIEHYVEENDIDRPTDFVVKQVADKSRLKVSIIQGVDKKLPLDDIASTVNLSMDDLISEMNVIVGSGTKLNLNYYIEENVDEYSLEDIFNYFKEADSESVEDAYQELKEDDVTMEEIQLVRLKFLSEMVN